MGWPILWWWPWLCWSDIPSDPIIDDTQWRCWCGGACALCGLAGTTLCDFLPGLPAEYLFILPLALWAVVMPVGLLIQILRLERSRWNVTYHDAHLLFCCYYTVLCRCYHLLIHIVGISAHSTFLELQNFIYLPSDLPSGVLQYSGDAGVWSVSPRDACGYRCCSPAVHWRYNSVVFLRFWWPIVILYSAYIYIPVTAGDWVLPHCSFICMMHSQTLAYILLPLFIRAISTSEYCSRWCCCLFVLLLWPSDVVDTDGISVDTGSTELAFLVILHWWYYCCSAVVVPTFLLLPLL